EVGGSDLAIPFVEEVPADADAQDHKKNGGPDGDANHSTLTAARAGGWGEKTFGDRLNVTGRLSPAASMTTPTSGRVRQKRAVGATPGGKNGGERGAASARRWATTYTFSMSSPGLPPSGSGGCRAFPPMYSYYH